MNWRVIRNIYRLREDIIINLSEFLHLMYENKLCKKSLNILYELCCNIELNENLIL